ncbi:ArnT family glycosyltransferase [Dictyobacter aurantiacus]|uniref:Glycosyltransferase RgtA/B/C/D-like domain-containing protein n=1 Tax=Dictyobacter aurantiacus TaxID=1936993 RepID=A0A401ZJ49_9CHLR|nr:glycosyltransferase family 39 protein [Dictyobacter aurantiacus]GCE06854.1 hypothetical protein KDAU_41830 [Dictyobacter aurantiacus]
MDTRLDLTTEDDNTHQASGPTAASTATRRTHALDLVFLLGLAIVALIPRLLLARQLDVVTDEVVYILGGKVYLPLITHANITSSQWVTFNYEHPPLAKVLMGISIAFNNILGHPVGELLAARIPSVVLGTLLVAAVYWLGRAPFGRTIALIAALSLAFSPWLAYFSALAYLDMTMTTFVTIAFLTLWHAIRRPWLFPVMALLVGLGAASKYTAVLVIPGIVIFTAYYYFLLRPTMPAEQRPALPWKWWGATILVAPLAFLLVDPAIWLNPIGRLIHSFTFEWNHSANGHPTFIAGQFYTHVPHWSIIFIIFTKMSAFLTIPAAIFVIVALVQLVRFHLRATQMETEKAASDAYLVIWLLSVLGMFSVLNIVVGTHYHLPLAPSVAIAGVSGLAMIIGAIARLVSRKRTGEEESATGRAAIGKPAVIIPVAILALLAIGPHLLGLTTVYAAEGYTNEFFQNNEDTTMQVAYPAYREALQWLETSAPAQAKVGLIGSSLNGYSKNTSWFSYNTALDQRFQLQQIDVTAKDFKQTSTSFQGYQYLVWPRHLVQRGYPFPANTSVIHTIMGGNTTYCYILKVNP